MTERVHHILSLLQQCSGDEIASVYSFLNAVLASSDPKTKERSGNAAAPSAGPHDHMQQDAGAASTYRYVHT